MLGYRFHWQRNARDHIAQLGHCHFFWTTIQDQSFLKQFLLSPSFELETYRGPDEFRY